MMRIKGKLTRQEFVNVCRNVGINTIEEIEKRYENYQMCYEGLSDGRSSTEVGATINEKELEYEDE